MPPFSPKEEYARMCIKVGCHANSQLMKDLPETIEGLRCIKKLDFSRSMMGRSDVEPLTKAILRHCSNLQVLNLSQNYLTDDNVIQICETIIENSPFLISLELSNNPLSNKAGRYLLRFIDSMPSIKYVGVQKTLMNDNVIRLIFQSSKTLSPSLANQRQGVQSNSVDITSSNSLILSKESCATSIQNTSKNDEQNTSPKHQWHALKTIWRAAAFAAPTNDYYSSLNTLISSTRINQMEEKQSPPH